MLCDPLNDMQCTFQRSVGLLLYVVAYSYDSCILWEVVARHNKDDMLSQSKVREKGRFL